MRILINNIIESWASAIECHDRIIAGFISLEYKKHFVSSLHNAVELCIKQKMLDAGDTKVASIKNVKTKAIAELYCSYFEAANDKRLNEFFSALSKDELNIFNTIEFSRMLELKNYCPPDSKASLTLLNNLRNNETHFVIDNSFLNENDFCVLHNFMIDFYDFALKQLFTENSFIVRIVTSPFKKEGDVSTFSKNIIFDRERMESFDYNKAVSENPLSKYIQKAYNEYVEDNKCSNTIFSLLQSEQFKNPYSLLKSYTFNEVYSMLISMRIIGMIHMTD